MEAPLTLLAIALVLLVIVGPILGIIAYSRTRRLDDLLRHQTPQDLTARIYALEQHLAKLEKSVVPAAPAVTSPVEQKPAAAPTPQTTPIAAPTSTPPVSAPHQP